MEKECDKVVAGGGGGGGDVVGGVKDAGVDVPALGTVVDAKEARLANANVVETEVDPVAIVAEQGNVKSDTVPRKKRTMTRVAVVAVVGGRYPNS